MAVPLTLAPDELATVLAALRFWQRQGLIVPCPSPEWVIACDDGRLWPLNAGQIDALCERVNAAD